MADLLTDHEISWKIMIFVSANMLTGYNDFEQVNQLVLVTILQVFLAKVVFVLTAITHQGYIIASL
jgi:hypothetical protein